MKTNVVCLDHFRKTGEQKFIKGQSFQRPAVFNNREMYSTFNQIINSISARYGLEQPQGGVIYNNPVSGMKLDSYGRGNVHNSVFQYLPSDKSNFNRPMPFPSDLRKVFRAIHKNQGRVMVLGYKSDPFMWMDQKYCQTKKILKYATKYKVQLVINTMSDLCGHDYYVSLIKAGNHSVVMNMSSENTTPDQERNLSPGAPSVRRRLCAVEILKQAGVDVTTQYHQIPETKEVCRRLGVGIEYIKQLNSGKLRGIK